MELKWLSAYYMYRNTFNHTKQDYGWNKAELYKTTLLLWTWHVQKVSGQLAGSCLCPVIRSSVPRPCRPTAVLPRSAPWWAPPDEARSWSFQTGSWASRSWCRSRCRVAPRGEYDGDVLAGAHVTSAGTRSDEAGQSTCGTTCVSGKQTQTGVSIEAEVHVGPLVYLQCTRSTHNKIVTQLSQSLGHAALQPQSPRNRRV